MTAHYSNVHRPQRIRWKYYNLTLTVWIVYTWATRHAMQCSGFSRCPFKAGGHCALLHNVADRQSKQSGPQAYFIIPILSWNRQVMSAPIIYNHNLAADKVRYQVRDDWEDLRDTLQGKMLQCVAQNLAHSHLQRCHTARQILDQCSYWHLFGRWC